MMQHTANVRLDDYWRREEYAGRLLLPPCDVERDVYLLWHAAREKYGAQHRELGLTLAQPGVRDYVHARACFYAPRITLTIALTPLETTAFGEQIGVVADSGRDGQTRHEIANLQAWYYPDVQTLMLWEVDLSSDCAEADPTQDFLLSCLWVGFETALLAQFPACTRLLTPFREPQYEDALFQTFLRERGYAPGAAGSGVYEKQAR